MKKIKGIDRIIEDLVNKLNFSIEINNVTINSSQYTINTCNTYWIRPCNTVVINGLNYKIVSIVKDESILLEAVGHTIDLVIGDIIPVKKPLFKHGTARAMNVELSKIIQKDKTPLIWLYEITQEKYIKNEGQFVKKEVPVRLFFFDESDTKNWNTSDHYINIIEPLENLVYELTKLISNDEGSFDDTEHTVIKLPDWGQFNQIKGFESRIFDELWSGIELQKVIKIKESPCTVCESSTTF